ARRGWRAQPAAANARPCCAGNATGIRRGVDSSQYLALTGGTRIKFSDHEVDHPEPYAEDDAQAGVCQTRSWRPEYVGAAWRYSSHRRSELARHRQVRNRRSNSRAAAADAPHTNAADDPAPADGAIQVEGTLGDAGASCLHPFKGNGGRRTRRRTDADVRG